MASLPTVGSDSGTWGTKLNEFLSQEHTVSGTHLDASETQKGVVKLATTAEVVTGTDTQKAVTPAGNAAALAVFVPDPGYLEYVALLTQTGTNAPVATILNNTLGVVPVWSYIATGIYPLTYTNSFPTGKTVIFLHNVALGVQTIYARNLTNDAVTVYTFNTDTGLAADAVLSQTMLFVRVYPLAASPPTGLISATTFATLPQQGWSDSTFGAYV
jgi:hypothetical protein